MGIRFACSHCGHVLNVKQELAGKRGICPECHKPIDIPQSSTVEKVRRPREADLPAEPRPPVEEPPSAPPASPAPHISPAAHVSPAPSAPAPVLASSLAEPAPLVDPIAEAPLMQWYVLPPGAPSPYGPAPGDMLKAWIAEGRVSRDSMVWRQDWPDWESAGKVLPQLSAVSIAPQAAAPPVGPPPAGAATVWHNSPTPAPVEHIVVPRARKKSPVAAIVALSVLVIILAVAAWWVIVR